MERVISRHRAVSILVMVLFAQIIGLAVQVRRPVEGRSVRLIRIWTMAAISPVEKGVLGIGKLFHNAWSGYIYLHGARKENESLKAELEQIRLQQVRDRITVEYANERIRRVALRRPLNAAFFDTAVTGFALQAAKNRQLLLHISDNCADVDFRSFPGKSHTTVLAARGMQIALLRELIDHLHQVAPRNIKMLHKLRNRTKRAALQPRVHQYAKRVIGLERQAHSALSNCAGARLNNI